MEIFNFSNFSQKIRKLVKKYIFLKMMPIVSILNKLLKTVGLLAVRLNVAELR